MSALLGTVMPEHVLWLAAALFSIGLVGVTCRRNVLVMLLSVEIMLNAANLAFVAFGKVHGDATGQVFVFFAMTIAAAEVAVGLAIVIAVYRLRRTADADAASDLRETHLGEVPPIRPEGPQTDAHGHGGHGHGSSPNGHGGGGGHGHGGGDTHPAPAHVEAH